jgi:ABC-type transporter MlaC component
MIYYYERNDLIMFRYNSEELILCNNVEMENIKECFKNMKFKSVDIGNMYGTLEYKENTYQKEIFKNIPLKHKRDEDPDGKIVLSSAWKELSPISLKDYIKNHQKKLNLNKDEYTQLLQYVTNKDLNDVNDIDDEKYIDKIKITFILELLLRNSNKFIKGDIISLYKDLKLI